MPAALVRVDGAARLRQTMKAAGLKLRDLSAVNRRTAAKVVQAAAPGTPRRSGALAASVKPSGTQRVASARSNLVYAPVVHYGWPGRGQAAQPWLFEAATATEPEWTGYYEAEIDKLLGTIKGA